MSKVHWLVVDGRNGEDQWKVILNHISRRHFEMEILMKMFVGRVTTWLEKLGNNGKILTVSVARVGPNFYSKLA